MSRLLIGIIAGLIGLGSVRAEQRPTTPKPSPKPAPPVAATVATPALTNEDVVGMVQAGLGESVILASVRTAKATKFDLSPAALIALKKNGVSDAIVSLMIDPTASVPAPSVPPPAVGVFPGSAPFDTRARIDSPTASPEIPREPGIYWDGGRDGAHDLTPLEPTVFSQAKSGGFLTHALTYGIAKINWKAVVRGAAASRKISQREPTFYFYFESKASGLGNTGGFAGWLSGATSPNEFVLARMRSKARERELIVGEIGAFGGSSGARSKDMISLQVDRLSGGIYRVRPAEPLPAGEYCFFYAGGLSTVGLGTSVTGKLFDFGIYGPDGR